VEHFAAPEYSFANPLDHNNHGAGDVRHLSEGAKAGIEEWLKGLSVQHPRTLIFPGSIAWKKSMTRNVKATWRRKRPASRSIDGQKSFTNENSGRNNRQSNRANKKPSPRSKRSQGTSWGRKRSPSNTMVVIRLWGI